MDDHKDAGLAETERLHSAACRAQDAQRQREADALQSGFEAGVAKGIVHGYDAAFWHESYSLLRQAILAHLDRFVHDDDVAEEAILINAIEKAGTDVATLTARAEQLQGELSALRIDGQALYLEHETLERDHQQLAARAEDAERERDAPVRCSACDQEVPDAGDLICVDCRTSPQWQPIETAPKDERILAFVPDEAGGYSRQIATYDDNFDADPPRPFWLFDGDQTGIYSRAHQPTMFMPLPAPPRIAT